MEKKLKKKNHLTKGGKMIKKMIPFFSILLVGLIVILVSSCAQKYYSSLPSTFWQNKTESIGVAIEKYPVLGKYRKGVYLIDIAVNVATSEYSSDNPLNIYLSKFDLSTFSTVAIDFVDHLNAEGLSANKLTEQIDLDDFPQYKTSKKGKYFNSDFSDLIENENIDMLMLLSIEKAGTFRESVMGIKLKPVALCQVKGELINLKTNEILWSYTTKYPGSTRKSWKESTQIIEGEWKQSPDYPNLSTALNKAINHAGKVLEERFFTK